jgi:hypothetical protein
MNVKKADCEIGAIQGASLFLAAGMSRLGELNPNKASQYGAAAATFIFIFTWVFAQTCLMIAFIYPAEIWPNEIRALGNAYGVFGRAVGCGVTTLVIPIMFNSLGYKPLIIFASFNFASLPVRFLPGEISEEELMR